MRAPPREQADPAVGVLVLSGSMPADLSVRGEPAWAPMPPSSPESLPSSSVSSPQRSFSARFARSSPHSLASEAGYEVPTPWPSALTRAADPCTLKWSTPVSLRTAHSRSWYSGLLHASPKTRSMGLPGAGPRLALSSKGATSSPP